MRLTRKQKATGLVAGGAAALALLGGAAATFTDSATAPAQNIASGTVDVTLGNAGAFTQSIENLADNDSFQRSVVVKNSGTIAFGGLSMAATQSGSVYTAAAQAKNAANVEGAAAAVDLSDAIDVVIGVDYADGSAGTDNAALYTGTLDSLANVTLAPLAAGEQMTLTFTYVLDVDGLIANDAVDGPNGTADAVLTPQAQQDLVNSYQGLKDSVNYTFTAVQRDAGVFNNVSPDGSLDGGPNRVVTP